MKTYWMKGPSPFKSDTAIPALIWANLRLAQNRVGRPLTKPEVISLIKLMISKNIFESKQDSNSVFSNFMATMKSYKLLSDEIADDHKS